MNDFNKPKENTPYNNENDEWSELTDMANGYNKSAATANKEHPGLTQRIMENLKKHPKAAKVLETLAISAMLTVAGLSMGITAGNVTANQTKAELLNNVTNSVVTFIDDNGENKPWKISNQYVGDDNIVHEDSIYYDNINCDINDKSTFAEQLEPKLSEFELGAKDSSVTIEWTTEDYIYTVFDKDEDGKWDGAFRAKGNSFNQDVFSLADDNNTIPDTMHDVEEYLDAKAMSE